MDTVGKSSSKWRKYIWIAIFLFCWAALYASQKGMENKIVNYTGPLISVTGKVVEPVGADKIDFPFGKYESEVHMDNGKIYVLYTDEIPQIDKGDVIVINLPEQYKESRNGKMFAKSYQLIKKAPLEITYH